ncbi:SRPBCC domain-containing protein [Rhodopila sp.]|uniref:SRPBCC family protein n=1 Tax=Rhodopila sp. TaxID=2480087 RepID=UPI003D0ACDAE
MDMTGERLIPAPRQTVWQALNNPEVLKASIPGCESLEKLDDDQMKATAAVKVGPISARFSGKVQLSDIDPPNGYRISGEGQGGVAGFAKGGADVALADQGAETLLSYKVNAQVGGKLAQLGGRLIDATAKQMADAFFDRFSKQVQAMSPAADHAEPAAAQTSPTEAPQHNPTGAPKHNPTGAPQPSPVAANATQPASGDRALSPERAEAAASQTMAEPVAVAVNPSPAAISIWSLIPREPFGLPLVAWLGSGVFVIMILLMLGSML